MPVYEFECSRCKHKFTAAETFQEHSRHKEKCPKCQSSDVRQQMSTIFAKTSKKS